MFVCISLTHTNSTIPAFLFVYLASFVSTIQVRGHGVECNPCDALGVQHGRHDSVEQAEKEPDYMDDHARIPASQHKKERLHLASCETGCGAAQFDQPHVGLLYPNNDASHIIKHCLYVHTVSNIAVAFPHKIFKGAM